MSNTATAGSDAWSSVTEQSIFLDDGLKFVVEVLQPPLVSAERSAFVECISEHKFETSSNAELSKRLLNACALQHGSYYKFFNYRQRALLGLWHSQKSKITTLSSKISRPPAGSLGGLKFSKGDFKPKGQPQDVSFSSHVSLLLLVPILQSQSRTDPLLAGECSELLLQCLQNCAPNSLSVEPVSCIKGLADLLCSWLQQANDEENKSKHKELARCGVKRESLVAALIALACGRLSIQLFIQVLEVLQQQRTVLAKLPVGGTLRKAIEYERKGSFNDLSGLHTSCFITCWQFEVTLTESEDSVSSNDQINTLVSDGKFLYLISVASKGLVKIGTGKHGTLRGSIYRRNADLREGWLAIVQGWLLFRPKEFDNKPSSMCYILDTMSLQIILTVKLKDTIEPEVNGVQPLLQLKTIQLLSDEVHLYWLWTTKTSEQTDQENRKVDLCLQEFKLESSEDELEVFACSCSDAVVVVRKEEPLASLSSPLPVRRSPTTPTPQKDADEIVSCGLAMSALKQSAMFISGDLLIIMVPQLTNPSAPMLLSLRGHRNPMNYCFSILDGSCVKHENVVNSATPKWQDLVIPGLSVCQDSVNGRLWSYGNSHIGEWVYGGYPSCNQVSRQLRTLPSSQCSAKPVRDLLDPVEASSFLAHHITLLCQRLDAKIRVALVENDSDVPLRDSADSYNTLLSLICNVLNTAISEGQHNVTIAMLVALQTLMRQASASWAKLDDGVVRDTRLLLWNLINTAVDTVGVEVQLEVCSVLKAGLEVFYPNAVERSALLMLLLSEGESTPNFGRLLDMILTDLAEEVMNADPGLTVKERLAEDVVFAALKVCVKQSSNMILQCGSMDDEAFQSFVAKHPDLSPVLQYLTAVFIASWRDVVISDKQGLAVRVDEVNNDVIKQGECQKLSLKILEACQQILDVVLEVLSKLSVEYKGDVKSRVEGLEHVMKATLVGQTLPLLASVVSSEKCLRLPMAKGFMPAVTNVTVTATRVAYFISELKSARECSPGDTTPAPSLSSPAVPSPWSSPRKVESPHPVRDEYQCCKTVVMPGASCLFVTFDPRCATQYEYDKVILYAGKTTTGRKVAEYGGNSFGVGSRGVIRLGWPKEPVKVEGDAVTISFQLKSTRERNTPDNAVWGFSCIISTKEHSEKSSKLPFFDDLCLGLSVLTYSLLNVRYQGPPNTESEDACQHLLDSKLLQRCVWPTTAEGASGTSGITITVESEKGSTTSLDSIVSKPSSKLSPELLKRLRVAAGVPAPTLRPSLRQALQPDAIEEVVLRCVINHLRLTKTVHGLELLQATETEGEEYRHLCGVMKDVFSRLNGLIRQLQSMAEMEQKWAHELDDVREGILQPSAAFFNDFHLQEAKSKELELLCSLKNVEFDPIEQEQSVGKLIQRLESEAKTERREIENALDVMPATKKFLFSVMECAELLCNVTIESSGNKAAPERSISHCSFVPDHGKQSQQSTSLNQLHTPSSPLLSRSLSAPSTLDQSTTVQEGIHDVRRLQRWRANVQKKHSRCAAEDQTDCDLNVRTFVSTVAEIFTFIGSDPDKAVTCSSFLAAARVRNERGLDRVQALQCMIELVTVCSRIGIHVPHLLSSVASILAQGPRTEELKCGGMVREVRDMFSAVVQAVVQLASSEPTVYRDSVVVLSVCPFSWHEERCVMRSSLVYLLDKLCSLRSERTVTALNLSAMAWAGFQVLLDRIVQWENDKDYRAGAIEWSGLAHQVSSLLSNYLNFVLEESRKDGVTARDALQYVMKLLHGISRSKLGEGILREPRTISTLLSLLLDRRAPPKLILIVLKLCRSALPLMSAKNCQEVTLPPSVRHCLGDKHGAYQESSSVVRVARLLLAKLGGFVLPAVDSAGEEDLEDDAEDYDENDVMEKSGALMCLYLHKRDDQPAHEVVQKVLSANGTQFIFRVGQGSEIERAIKLDRELTEYGRGVLLTDTLSACLKKAVHWAQTGLVVSVGPVGLLEGDEEGRKPTEGSGDPESVCKARNSRLSRTESSRPFISGQVAHTMASEMISLLHGLLASSASETAKIWTSAVRDVLCEVLDYVPDLIRTLEMEGRVLLGGDKQATEEQGPHEDSQLSNEHEWFLKARNVMASLCALGGFRQSVHSGCTVQICGEDMMYTTGEVVSVSDRQGVATVLLDNGGKTYSDRLQEIPLARLKVTNTQVVFLSELSLGEQAVASLLSILSSRETLLDQPSVEDQSENIISPSPATRILAELKTRASMVLSCQVQDPTFGNAILASPSLELISRLGGECDPGLRLPVMETHCQQLRKLFKDFVKPGDEPKKEAKSGKKMVLDGSRPFPPVRGCVFTEGYTCVHLMADPAAGFGLPRGTFVYASAPLPQRAPSFYWEVELCSLGDAGDQDPGPCISVGFAPWTDQLSSGWINPVGSCLLHSNGRAVLYRAGGLLQWKTVSLNIVMKENDIIGCGYKKAEDHSDKGLAYFTYNGQRLVENLDGVQPGLWPVIHIQKKNVRVRVNFGARSFIYAEGFKHRVAADMWSDSLEDLREGFTVLPFALEPDKEDAKDESTLSKVSKPSPPKPAPLTIPKDTGKEYDPMSCLQYKLTSSYDRMTDAGPVVPLRVTEESTSKGREAPPVDPARLLVKAWEDKVFPVIRRRFRSNTDRQSGLEQIKGALLAGMIDIAIATVADLYEDNGGIPASLQFPKLDDVKAEVNKVSAGGLRPGQAVIINSSTLNQASALPGFAVPDMKKTFGLTGVVKNVDKPKGLAEVETYNREEGTLMRFWYPISALERPTAGLARSSSLALCSEDRTRADIYCELLRNEAGLTRMYCREAHSRLLAKKAKSDNQLTDILSLLQTLATQLLAVPQSDGTIIVTSPHSAPDPRHCLTANTLQPSAIFFSEPARLISEVRKLVSLAAEQDEEEVLRVVNTVCEGLKDAPLGGYHREVPISPGKQDEEVLIPGAAVTVVSCREDPGCLSTGGVANPRSPCVSISCYHGNQKLNKNGQVARYKVVQYPNATDPNTSGSANFNLYPDMILPCNRLHLHFFTSATEGLMVHVNAFPAEFFLSLVFIEVFVSFYLENAAEFSRDTENRMVENSGGNADRSKATVQKTVALNLTDMLSSFLLRSNLPAVIKEIVCHLLAQLLRACHHVQSQANQPHSPEHLFTLHLVLSRLVPLRTELQKLLEKELSATNTAALDFILNCNFEHGEFSSYLQALLGLVSAANEVSSSRGKSGRGLSLKEVREALQAAVSLDSTNNEVRSAPPTSVENTFNFDAEAIVPPSSTETAASSGPPSPKIKASERRGSVRRRKRGFGHGITSPTESMPWFDKIVSTTLLLRNLIHGDPRGSLDLSNSLTAVISTRSTALQRLLVITNIATTLSKKETVDAIKKACRPSGGIHDSDVYIPEVEPRVTAGEPRREQDSEGVDSRVKSMTELLPSARRDKPERILGYAVVELKSASQLDLVRQAISSSKTLKDQSSVESNIGVAKVNSELLMEGTNELSAFAVFDEFLNARLFDGGEAKTLSKSAAGAMAEIFSSCALVASGEVKSVNADSTPSDSQSVEPSGQDKDITTAKSVAGPQSQEFSSQNSEPVINKDVNSKMKSNQSGNKSLSEEMLTKDQICGVTPGNLLLSFFNAVRHAKESAVELVTQLLRDHGRHIEGSEERALGFNGFVNWALARGSQDVRSIWKGLIACGYDLQFKRCTYFLSSEMEADHANWPLARDHALVLYVDTLCRAWSTTPSRLMPDELLLSEVDLTSEDFHLLQGLSLRSLRSRFAFLKALNSDVERLLLPVTDLRAADTYNLSTATLLREGRGLLFYHTKVALLNHVLNHTAHRGADDSPPEVSLDPLEALEADKVSSAGPQFCQAARDISALSSSGLRVKVATGGDPVFPLKVQLRGEQVLGSGGSFRHFMWLMARELQGTHVGLLIPCPSSAANKNKGKFIMKPGPMTYAEEKLLIFFGQLLGIALRSDIPLALDLLPCFWKSLLNLPFDPHDDLRETDILTYNYLRRFSEVANMEEFQMLCFEADLCPYRFVYTSLDGEEVELCKDGANVAVTWENHKSYVQAIRNLRLKELRCESRMAAVRCGLSSVVPLHVLTVMTPLDMEIRTCGQPSLDLGFLKAHTAYVAGVKDTDVHIEYFWNSMESFSQDQLRKFVKFACNQERLPSRCTCQDGNPHTADVHVPPYPMKIGPPDGRGASDARYIRVETCMFMVKLPQYSTQEKMTEKLMYAINCREDPLTDMT